VINERFVAFSTVTWSRIRGCSSEPKRLGRVCRAYLKETGAQHSASHPELDC